MAEQGLVVIKSKEAEVTDGRGDSIAKSPVPMVVVNQTDSAFETQASSSE